MFALPVLAREVASRPIPHSGSLQGIARPPAEPAPEGRRTCFGRSGADCLMYRASETRSVLDRLTGLATAVRVVCALVFAVLCGPVGAVLGASLGFATGRTQDAAAGGFWT